MTGHDGRDDHTPDHDGEPIADPSVQRAVQHLLRTDPVDVDTARREAAIEAALGAFDERPVDLTTPTRRPGRRRFLQPALAAAAAVVLVVGAVAVSTRIDSGSETADSGGTQSSGADSLASADGADGTSGERSAARQREVEASGESGPAEAADPGPVVDLGAHPDLPALFAAADHLLEPDEDEASGAQLDPEPTLPGQTDATASAALDRCAADLRGLAMEIVASATLDGTQVLVATTADSEVVVWRVDGCVELDRR